MKRIIIIESEDIELLNRFSDRIDELSENLQLYEFEIELSHFKEDE